MHWTQHASARIEERAVSEFVTKAEIENALSRQKFDEGETHVIVREIGRTVKVAGSVGDRVVVSVHRYGNEEPSIVTVMFRNSRQKNTRPTLKLIARR